MARKTKSPLSLPQTDDQWYCAIRKLRTFVRVNEEGDEFIRPSITLIIDIKTGLVLAAEITQEPIAIQDLNEKLLQIILKPPKEYGFQPHRPAEVHFEDESLASSMQPLLAEVQVTARYEPQRETVNDGTRRTGPGAVKGIRGRLVRGYGVHGCIARFPREG